LDYLPAEANGLHLKLDATANLRFWAALRGVTLTDEMATIALGRVALDHPLLRQRFPVEKYSTGMKRRLALARLALSPAPCWILDEPVSGLDTSGIALFRELVGDHLRRGGLALVVSHDVLALEGIKGGAAAAPLRTIDLFRKGRDA
jgi:heme exporter protein A